MFRSWQKSRWVTVISLVSICAATLGCAFLSDLTSKSTDTAMPQPTQPHPTQAIPPIDRSIPTESIPTGQPIPTAVSPTQGEPIIPERPLGLGPWMLIQADDGMWAVNPDGSGLTFLTEEVPAISQDLEKSASPEGGAIALVTSIDPNTYANLTLKLLSLPDGQVETLTPLTSATTEPGPNPEPGSPGYNIMSALSLVQNFEWSPDGTQLAFMGAMKGPSVDLYVYSFNSGQITQLTDGPSQGIKPTWSPDGAYIVHTGVGSLGTGAGYDMQGIWAAASDNSSVVSLYPIPDDSGDEIILGWVSPRKFLVYTWNVVCGYKNLRTYDLSTGKTEVLWENFFSSVIFSPEAGTTLLGVDQWTAECNPGGSEGIFLLHPGEATPLKALYSSSAWMDWYPSVNLFLVRIESKLYSVSPDGVVKWLTEAPGAEFPNVSPDGQLWAFSESVQGGSPGMWLGQFEEEAERIFPEATWNASWSPGDEGIFFFSYDGLYFAPAPSFEPVLIGEGIHVTHVEPMTWVYP